MSSQSNPQSSPSATTKTVSEILLTFAKELRRLDVARLTREISPEQESTSRTVAHMAAEAAINNYTTQAVIKELEAHIIDLSYAVGYTDGQPFLKRQLELCKERLDKLKGGIDE